MIFITDDGYLTYNRGKREVFNSSRRTLQILINDEIVCVLYLFIFNTLSCPKTFLGISLIPEAINSVELNATHFLFKGLGTSILSCKLKPIFSLLINKFYSSKRGCCTRAIQVFMQLIALLHKYVYHKLTFQ